MPSTGETTVFVYDASGELVVEYSANVVPVQDAKVNYLTSDHLGSPRISTDAYGAVISRHDYHPFGEEKFRASYGSDSIRRKFSVYQRDEETDLDFAVMRTYQRSYARFSQPDPYNIIFEKERGRNKKEKNRIFRHFVDQPQNWNRYVYVINNPQTYVDPLGLIYLAANGTTYYVPDEVYRRDGFKKWFEKEYGKFSVVPNGTRFNVGPNATGIFAPFRGQTVVLMADGLLLPVTSNHSMGSPEHEPDESPSMSARETAWVRTPDFYQGEADIPLVPFGGVALQGTFDRDGQFYVGVRGYLGSPGGNVSGGYLPQGYAAYPSENENFLTGGSIGFSVARLGGTYSNNGQFAPQVGTSAPPSVSATYCFRTPLNILGYQPQ